MAGGFFFAQIFLALKPVPTMIGGVVCMIGLGLCRIGVGMAGVVLSYRVTLNGAALRPLCIRCQFS